MPRHKILYVIPTLDQSGAEKQLALLALGLPRDRFQPHICALTRGGHFEAELAQAGIPVTVLHKRLALDPSCLWRLHRLIERVQPDLVHTWLFAANCYGRLTARLHRVRAIVASERCVDVWKRPHELAIDRFLARWTNRLVANSVAVGEFYAKVGYAWDHISVIPNGIGPLPEARSRAVTLREEIGVPAESALVVFVGRLWPQKRVQDLIWAMDILRHGGLSAHLAIVGSGPRRPALERFTRDLDLTDRIHFLGHRPDAVDWLRAADVVVLPSLFEGMPNVVLEAMALAKPVVATRIPGMDELVLDEVTGLLVEPKKPFELARGLYRLLEDPLLRESMGKAAAERAGSDFSLAKMIERHVELYQALLA